jgi:predicted Holliday junction resolvase-like endonuclease
MPDKYRPITSFQDIPAAYKELPNIWKVLFWVILPVIVILAALAFFYTMSEDVYEGEVKRQSKKFSEQIDKSEKKAAKLLKEKAAIQKKGEKVIKDAQKLLDDIGSSDLSFYEQQQLRKRITEYRRT